MLNTEEYPSSEETSDEDYVPSGENGFEVSFGQDV